MKPNTSEVDIILVTCFRQQLLEETLKSIKERTRLPHRLIVVNNGANFESEYKKGIEQYLNILIENPTNIGFGGGMNRGFKEVRTEYFVTTCDDILPPDLEPCWLERLATLLDLNPEYGGLNSRCQKMRNYSFGDESLQVYEHNRTLASSFRIQRKTDIEKLGGVPLGYPYESKSFAHEIHTLGLKTGCAAHIHCNHIGHGLENKGYPEGFDYQFKKNDPRPLPPIIDPKTNVLIGHVCPSWPHL